MTRRILWLVLFLLTLAVFSTSAQTVYMQDTPADTGVEPNPDTGPMWVSDDIWVRTSPDPGYQPYPFLESSPPWTPLPNQNPEYRDPKYSLPNYIYVRVHNHGTTASTGTERLRVYAAKASTGLSWPTQWVDYVANTCGPSQLFGIEVTKPRINAATASAAQINAYVSAILAIGNNPAYVFPLGIDYWHTQNEVHSMGPFNRHETDAFLPWHREFVNRYEVLLQQADPTVKLFYWDWTTNPTSSTGGVNIDTSSFMGNSSGSIGAPFNPASPPTLAPPSVTRGLGGSPPAELDSAVLARNPYGPFTSFSSVPPPTAPFMSALEDYSHNYSHGYIGGNMSFLSTAAQDPFFFLLHGNVDRLWAQWQRNPSNLARLDPATTYGSETTNVNITTSMEPWDGTTRGGAASIQPWTTAGGYIVSKLPTDPSVVSPPIYDTAPLTIPVLQPGEAVVIQIPWYPPNPANFSCFGSDQGHFCLLSRIETSNVAPFGMDFPETSDVNANTRNNNKIVWRNETVVDDFPGPMMIKSVLLRNIFDEPVQVGLRFAEPRTDGGSFLKQGRVFVDLKRELFERWRQSGAGGRGIKAAGEERTGRIEILSADASIHNITIGPNETFPVNVEFVLSKDYSARQGSPAKVDLIQVGAPGHADKVVGGQRFTLDFSRLVLIKTGDDWRYWDKTFPGREWSSPGYDDASWTLANVNFGRKEIPAAMKEPGSRHEERATAYFRHSFEVSDPGFYRTLLLRLKSSEGAVVYLNGKEIDRVNEPGLVKMRTAAEREAGDLRKDVLFPVKLNPADLRSGKNVVAVEVHQGTERSGNLGFDLELSANRADSDLAPDLAFIEPPNGALFRPGEIVSIKVQALDTDGKIRSVSLYADGELVRSIEQPPYSFRWEAKSIGAHRFRAVAVDDDQKQTTTYLTISVVEKVPPAVKLSGLLNAKFRAGDAISVSADASDRTGSVKRVEFWVKEAELFTSPSKLAATVTTPPYKAQVKDLKPGHYMIWAIAVNDRDATSQSLPMEVTIGK
jgi:hypothetical protein